MASPEQGAEVAAAIVEDVMRLHGEGGTVAGVGGGETVGAWRNIDIAWRKAEEAGELVSCIDCVERCSFISVWNWMLQFGTWRAA